MNTKGNGALVSNASYIHFITDKDEMTDRLDINYTILEILHVFGVKRSKVKVRISLSTKLGMISDSLSQLVFVS